MSHADRRRRDRPPRSGPDAVALFDPTKTSAIEAARAAARAQGCTCEPEVTVDGLHASLRHDAWCLLLRKGDVN